MMLQDENLASKSNRMIKVKEDNCMVKSSKSRGNFTKWNIYIEQTQIIPGFKMSKM